MDDKIDVVKFPTNRREMVFGEGLRRLLPYVNFVVATSALGFQYFVLYPWHKELEKDFRELRDEHNSTLEEYHKKKLVRLEGIESNIERLKATTVPIIEVKKTR